MLAALSSILFLSYFSVIDFLNGECTAWKMYTALIVQFCIYVLSGSPNFLLLSVVVLYGLVLQFGGLWFGADTGALILLFMQSFFNPFLLVSMLCFSLVLYMLAWVRLRPDEHPRLVPAFFLALVLTSLIQLVSVFPTSI